MAASPQLLKTLADRGAQGDPAALEALIVCFEAAVFRLCFRILGDETLAEDARQETFVRMLRSLERFDPRRPFSTWLLSIATHVALDLARDRRRTATTEGEADARAAEPLEDVIREEDLERLDAALELLEPRARALLALRFQEELSPMEISRVLKISANQVRVELWRARQALRRALRIPEPERRPSSRVLPAIQGTHWGALS